MSTILLQKILMSIAIGALIGMERERSAKADIQEGKGKKGKKVKKGKKDKKGKKQEELVAGFRTFTLFCLFGLLASHLTSVVGTMWPIYIGIASVAVLAFISYYLSYKKFGAIGMTTEVALFLTFIIGIMIYFEAPPHYFSVALGIIITIILFFREPLHQFAYGLGRKEIRDAIVFAALLFIISPLLPKQPIDPLGAINPTLIWESMLVVMIVSFSAYVAMKVFGERLGSGIAGVFGGLASSTSVALMMANEVKKNKKALYSALFSITISSSTMFFRMLIVSLVFGYTVGMVALPILMLLSCVGFVLSYIPFEKTKKIKAKISLDSPIAFRPILQFMGLFIITIFAINLAKLYVPSAIFLVAALSGLFDVDAINISLSSMAFAGAIPIKTAVVGLILAAIANTISKAALVRWIGGKRIGKEIFKLFSILIFTAVVALAIMWICF